MSDASCNRNSGAVYSHLCELCYAGTRRRCVCSCALYAPMQMEKHPALVKYVEAVASATRTIVPRPASAARGGWHRSTAGEPPSPRWLAVSQSCLLDQGVML